MEVKCKYQIGERVFFLDQNGRATHDEIVTVVAYMKKDSVEVKYDLPKALTYLTEDRVFATEAELKEHVFGDLIEFV